MGMPLPRCFRRSVTSMMRTTKEKNEGWKNDSGLVEKSCCLYDTTTRGARGWAGLYENNGPDESGRTSRAV